MVVNLPRDYVSPELRRLLQGPPDANVLEAALLRTIDGGCSRAELAWALGWLPERLERAITSLEAQLEERALMFVSHGEEVYIAPRHGLLGRTALDRLDECIDMRAAPCGADLARVAVLITERMTQPEPTEVCAPDGTCDPDLYDRGLLAKHRTADHPADCPATVEVHADVYFGLGLAAWPFQEDVPPRPDKPESEKTAGETPNASG